MTAAPKPTPQPTKTSFKDKLAKAAAVGPDPRAIALEKAEHPDNPIVKAAEEQISAPKEVAKPDESKAPEPPKPAPKEAKVEAPKAPEEKAEGLGQVLNRYKKLSKQYEGEIATLKQQLAKSGDVAEVMKRAEQSEARLKELESHMRYVDYSKSTEFQDKYEKPYNSAWEKAGAEMAELTIETAEGTRAANAQDLLRLVNLPLGEARKMARELFGDAADDVMAHRRVVRDLADSRQKALADAQKDAGEHEKLTKAKLAQVQESTVNLWKQHTAEDAQKYEFLKEKEGDEEWNGKLGSASKFVDSAIAAIAKVNDPSLSDEDRAKVIRDYASVRGRAVAFSALKLENKRLAAQLAERDAALAKYKSGEPTAGNGKPNSGPAQPTNRMGAFKSALQKAADSNPAMRNPPAWVT